MARQLTPLGVPPDPQGAVLAPAHECAGWMPPLPTGSTPWCPAGPSASPGQALWDWLMVSLSEGWTRWSLAPGAWAWGHRPPSPQGPARVALSEGRLPAEEILGLLERLYRKPLPNLHHPSLLFTGPLFFEVECFPTPGVHTHLQVNAAPMRSATPATWQMDLRLVPTSPPSAQTLGMPEALRTLADTHRDCGLWLWGGQAHSGRSTSLSALLRERLRASLPHPRERVTVLEHRRSHQWSRLVPAAPVFELSPLLPSQELVALVNRLNPDVVIGEAQSPAMMAFLWRQALSGVEPWVQSEGHRVSAVVRQWLNGAFHAEPQRHPMAWCETVSVVVAQQLLPHDHGQIAVWEWLVMDGSARRVLSATPLDAWETTVERIMAERGSRFVDQAPGQRALVSVTRPEHVRAWDEWLNGLRARG